MARGSRLPPPRHSCPAQRAGAAQTQCQNRLSRPRPRPRPLPVFPQGRKGGLAQGWGITGGFPVLSQPSIASLFLRSRGGLISHFTLLGGGKPSSYLIWPPCLALSPVPRQAPSPCPGFQPPPDAAVPRLPRSISVDSRKGQQRRAGTQTKPIQVPHRAPCFFCGDFFHCRLRACAVPPRGVGLGRCSTQGNSSPTTVPCPCAPAAPSTKTHQKRFRYGSAAKSSAAWFPGYRRCEKCQ